MDVVPTDAMPIEGQQLTTWARTAWRDTDPP
jgi:hypothetical protein